ncbi:NAD(P)-binding domain-containing protein [Kutzneria kofuensis]|uniref:Thioredoxin reductase n=1 Tax=Kutzneria kofuensis TaxID=103725 RepID=A0A7W9KU45_9PSEU|nr:NAD(P)-binding domain-containing protein [Kutzneria kofuensis]MBB5898009.1 thioredoxin reductase [Kutzneria kofuensis]
MPEHVTDYLVVGAGPAGLQLAHLLHRGGHDYLVLDEGAAPGGFFTKFPRHRQLISSNKRFTGSDDPEVNLRMDWNSLLSDDPSLVFTKYSEEYFPAADDYVRYLADYASRLDLNIQFGCRVREIARDGDEFVLTDQHGTRRRSRRVVVATGLSVPNVPEIRGIELAEQYSTVSTDPAEFTNQRVLIIGKGNSAFETADNLVSTTAAVHIAGPKPVRLAWDTHFVGHVRAVNNNFLDTYELKSGNAVLNVGVERIDRDDAGYHVRFRFSRGPRVVDYDRVIVCAGFRFDATIFADGCRPALDINDRFPELTSGYESTSVDGLFFAGTLTQQLDYRVSTNGFIHGYRYGARALYRLLDERYHGTTWPHTELAADPAGWTRSVLARINRSSGLWQQFGELADVLVVPGDGPVRHFEEMPLRHLADRAFEPTDTVFAVTLEYGPHPVGKKPFDGSIVHASEGEVTSFFHPVVRQYRAGELVATHHLDSDMENRWQDGDGLTAFLADAVGTRVAT